MVSKRIVEEIEKTADFYQPAVYELLSFYHALQNQNEPLDGQFIPLTTAQPWEQKRALFFAVGLIPPTANLTERILDRSASIASLLGAVTISPEEADELEIEDVRAEITGIGRSTVEPTEV